MITFVAGTWMRVVELSETKLLLKSTQILGSRGFLSTIQYCRKKLPEQKTSFSCQR